MRACSFLVFLLFPPLALSLYTYSLYSIDYIYIVYIYLCPSCDINFEYKPSSRFSVVIVLFQWDTHTHTYAYMRIKPSHTNLPQSTKKMHTSISTLRIYNFDFTAFII